MKVRIPTVSTLNAGGHSIACWDESKLFTASIDEHSWRWAFMDIGHVQNFNATRSSKRKKIGFPWFHLDCKLDGIRFVRKPQSDCYVNNLKQSFRIEISIGKSFRVWHQGKFGNRGEVTFCICLLAPRKPLLRSTEIYIFSSISRAMDSAMASDF